MGIFARKYNLPQEKPSAKERKRKERKRTHTKTEEINTKKKKKKEVGGIGKEEMTNIFRKAERRSPSKAVRQPEP